MLWLSSSEPEFGPRFSRLVADRRESEESVSDTVRAILNDVRERGDVALADYTTRFDRHALVDDSDWRVPAADCAAAFERLEPRVRDALELAATRIEAYHRAQRPQDRDYRDETGARLGARWTPVEAAGLYVPGGRAAYPSSLLMNAIPARVAGVERLVVASPAPGGETNPLVLAAAHLAGIEEFWRIGGAQAIGALAYGTDRIAPVDAVTGPGNSYVAEAKRQLFGVVGIDMMAGPSEILVIADGRADPEWIAADLLSQAEHDPSAQAILITNDNRFAQAVADAVHRQINHLATADTARDSWDTHGVIILVDNLADEAPPLANRLAAEHVALALDDPEPMFARIRHAGSVFLGRLTPEAVGDYVAGPNHVLPTGRRARFASGLSVLDFMKRTSFLSLDRGALETIGPAAMVLAEIEGLPAHARSVAVRLT